MVGNSFELMDSDEKDHDSEAFSLRGGGESKNPHWQMPLHLGVQNGGVGEGRKTSRTQAAGEASPNATSTCEERDDGLAGALPSRFSKPKAYTDRPSRVSRGDIVVVLPPAGASSPSSSSFSSSSSGQPTLRNPSGSLVDGCTCVLTISLKKKKKKKKKCSHTSFSSVHAFVSLF